MAWVRRNLGWATRTAAGRRTVRYTAVSAATAVFGQVVLIVTFGILRWSGTDAALFSFLLAALASYQLNRTWVWRRRGRSNLLREVAPFLVVAAVGLALSTAGVVVAEHRAAAVTDNRAVQTAFVLVGSWGAVVAVWVLKYLILERYVFTTPTLEGSPAER